MNGIVMPLHGVRRRAALPRSIRTLVRRLPRVPSSVVVAALLNLLLRKRLPDEVFERLGERPFSIEVRDADLVMAFRCIGRRFLPVPHVGEAVLRFRVSAADFATLAATGDAPGAHFLHDFVAVGDPVIATDVRRALDGIDVVRTRRILRCAVRRAERELARD